MTDKRERIATVLRVRRVQELQAAGELSRATRDASEAERVLGALHRHYDAHRATDGGGGPVPSRLHDHETRARHAQAIQHGREKVHATVVAVDERRLDLVVRSAAVAAMSRLDERLAVEEEVETRRLETRAMDEFAVRPRRGALA